ncbi:ribonucleotide reductase inhibitor-domain-containing protein [Aspergillus venezuelensis]
MATTTPKPLDSKRRRFQPPITTFFTASSGLDTPSTPSHLSHNHYAAITNSPTPVVPAKVQASLLSVGMRVRKSIADGYKTMLAKEEKQIIVEDTSNALKARISIAPTNRSELAPFCGMSKSSEYSSAPRPLPHPVTYTHHHHHHHHHDSNQFITTDEDNDAFSLPPSSQGSVDSELDRPVTVPTQRKRPHQDFDFDPYEDDMDEADVDDYYTFGRQDLSRLHPITNTTGRAILSPTLNTQRRRAVAAQKFTSGQRGMELDDFEEPAFLRRREEVDMDVDC